MIRFSVIIPTFNYAHFLERCLISVVEQDFNENYEIIVVDDASEDETEKVLKKWVSKAPYLYVLRHSQNRGPAAARNTGLRAAQGEYILFLDADDELLPGALSCFDKILRSFPEADVIMGAVFQEFRGKRKLVKPFSFNKDNEKNFLSFLKRKLRFYHGSYIVRREVMLNNLYPENLRIREDFPVWGTLVALYNCISFEEPVVIIRKHDGRLRYNICLLQERTLKSVDILFERLPCNMSSYYSLALSRECLSIFRTFYQLRDVKNAMFYYHKAIKLYPRHVFLFSYFNKYIRLRLKLL